MATPEFHYDVDERPAIRFVEGSQQLFVVLCFQAKGGQQILLTMSTMCLDQWRADIERELAGARKPILPR